MDTGWPSQSVSEDLAPPPPPRFFSPFKCILFKGRFGTQSRLYKESIMIMDQRKILKFGPANIGDGLQYTKSKTGLHDITTPTPTPRPLPLQF